jgi:glycine cleavage system H protein
MIPPAESKPRPSGPANQASGESPEREVRATRTVVSPPSADTGEPCVWMSAGVLAFKLCDRCFECERCPLDLALGAVRVSRPPEHAPRVRLGFPDDRVYSAGHGWVLALDANRVRTGVDALAARLVQRVHAIVLPAAGTRVRAGEPLGWIFAENEPLPIAAPIDGVVLAANPRVRDDPALALRDPYGAGWLVELSREPSSEQKPLEDARSARKRAGRDLRALRKLAERRSRDLRVGPTAYDGGVRVRDPRVALGERRYQRWLARLLG